MAMCCIQVLCYEEGMVLYKFSRSMTAEEILCSWEDKKNLAATNGTHAHLQVELYLNDMDPEPSAQDSAC